MFARAWVAALALAAAVLVGAAPAQAEPSTLISYADDTGTRNLGSGFDTGVAKPKKMVLKVKVEPNVRIELEYQVFCRGKGEEDGINKERETRSRRIRLPLVVKKPRSCLVYAFASFDGPSEREVHFRIELRAKSRGHQPPPPDQVPPDEIRVKLSVDPLVIGSPREATVRAIGRDAGKFLTGVDLRIDRPDGDGGWEPAYLAFASTDEDPFPPYALPPQGADLHTSRRIRPARGSRSRLSRQPPRVSRVRRGAVASRARVNPGGFRARAIDAGLAALCVGDPASVSSGRRNARPPGGRGVQPR